MKRLLIGLIVFIVLLGVAGCLTSRTSEFSFSQVSLVSKYRNDCKEIEEFFITERTKGMSSYQVYDASELTAEILENRNGVTIIERCIGKVINEQTGDGVLLNYQDPEYNYISYSYYDKEYIRNGTIILSYMIYNPHTNDVDDIMERHDYIICK